MSSVMICKRRFREVSRGAPPLYPTHHEFEPTRHSLLARLGRGVLAVVAASALLASCGDRPIDEVKIFGGLPDGRRARIDAGLEAVTAPLGGLADAMPAWLDGEPGFESVRRGDATPRDRTDR